MFMVKAVIFDLDGVLVHTDELHYQAWKKIADELSIPFDHEVNNRLRGVSRMESLDIILSYSNKTFSLTEREMLAEEKNEEYKRLLGSLGPKDLVEGALELLKYLKDKGIRVAIGSSSKNTKYILQRLGIIDEFDAISDGNNISKSKPDPEVFIKAASYLYLKVEDCMVVEDARSGIDAAYAGGFKSFGISDAAKYEKTNYPIEKLLDITKIIK
jgi:beta-phosphoglucomutase